jgi:hypothetical protein
MSVRGCGWLLDDIRHPVANLRSVPLARAARAIFFEKTRSDCRKLHIFIKGFFNFHFKFLRFFRNFYVKINNKKLLI